MNFEDLTYYYNKFKFGDENFHKLMQKRISSILLISSVYDAYVLEKDGLLSEQIYGEFRQLDLSISPRIKHISFSEDILSVLESGKYDLIIMMMRVRTVSAEHICQQIKEKYPELPLQLLVTKSVYFELVRKNKQDLNLFDEIFLWTGNSNLFIAMIKSAEDRMNAEFDATIGHVRIVLMIERSIEYYSLYLPLYYSEVMKLTQELIDFELHDADKRLRMRGRPKILLAHNFTEALNLYKKFQQNIICVVTNVNLSVKGTLDARGGIKLVRKLRNDNQDLPILIQSADPSNEIEAKKLNCEFYRKDSHTLLTDIRHFFVTNLGFGDFIFRKANGEEIDRARSMYHFEKKIMTIPEESLLYHTNSNHFSAWLMAHGEVEVAKRIRYIFTADFLTSDEIRKFLTTTINRIRKEHNKGKVVKYNVSIFTEEGKITQLAEGSLGGKGRGLAFLNAFLASMELNKEFDNIDIKLPRTAIIGTNEFDNFLENNAIAPDQINDLEDKEINRLFLAGSLTTQLKDRLLRLISNCSVPLAVRSSGLLEDSQTQPFAGVYATYMLPNNEETQQKRLQKLQEAIKLIFASPFREQARRYLNSIDYKTEEEKMAVVIQEIVGSLKDDDVFCPFISGTAQSYNFYPIKGMKHEEGVAALAVGLGKEVVDGGLSYRFCPYYPRIDFQKPADIVQNSQRFFYAVDLNNSDYDLSEGEDATLRRVRITQDILENSFRMAASVWDYQRLSFNDSSYVKGPLALTYRNVIHFKQIPLPAILRRILEIGKIGLGVPVEIEFALKKNENEPPSFYLLQIRPLSVNLESMDLDLKSINQDDIGLLSTQGIGNGQIDGISDIVFIDPAKFDNTKTLEMTGEIDQINQSLKQAGRHFVLIGPGRWGTSDRFLGIPLRWSQIDMAKVIVETSLDQFNIESSQGSHFFHNLVAMNIVYLAVPSKAEKDFIDWQWLFEQKIIKQSTYATHVRTEFPFTVKTDGRKGISVLLK
jgi:CheY-like chemotaxis protein